MIVFSGHRLYGKIDRCGSTYIATRFFHIQFVPLIPLGSHLVLATQGNQIRSIPLPVHARSLVAGYVRVLGGIAAVIAAISALAIGNGAYVDAADLATAVFVAVVAGGASLVSLLWVGRLSHVERARRLAYAQMTGHPYDVALLPADQRGALRDRVAAHVAARAGQLVAATGYRGGSDGAQHWARAALDPGVTDPGFLVAALTLARLEWAAASGPVRAQIDQTHGAILQKLVKVDPRLPAAASALNAS